MLIVRVWRNPAVDTGYREVVSHERRKGNGWNVPCTLHACGTNRVCTTADNEPVRQEHARANREEPDGVLEARCVRRLEEERDALHTVGVWLAKQDCWHGIGDVRMLARTATGNETASPGLATIHPRYSRHDPTLERKRTFVENQIILDHERRDHSREHTS